MPDDDNRKELRRIIAPAPVMASPREALEIRPEAPAVDYEGEQERRRIAWSERTAIDVPTVPEDHQEIVEWARDYAAWARHEDVLNDPRTLVRLPKASWGEPLRMECEYLERIRYCKKRLEKVIKRPEFIISNHAVEVMRSLKNLPKGKELWSFNMYTVPITEGECERQPMGAATRRPEQGFGLEQIDGFYQLIQADILWDGTNEGLKNTFFASVSDALKAFSKNHPLETALPRMVLIDQVLGRIEAERRDPGTYHNPICSARFSEHEEACLDGALKTATPEKEKLKSDILGKLAVEGPNIAKYIQTVHYC